MTGHNILPVALSKLWEGKLSNFSNILVTLIIPNSSSFEILGWEVHALELVEETYVSERSISRAWKDISCSVHHRVILSSIKPDFHWCVSVPGSLSEQSWLNEAFFEKPHLDRVSICRRCDKNRLVWHKLNTADLLLFMSTRKRGVNLLFVQIPKRDVLAIGFRLGNARQHGDAEAQIRTEWKRQNRSRILSMLKVKQNIPIKNVDQKYLPVLKT